MSISAEGVFDWYRPTLPHEADADVMLAYQRQETTLMSEPTNAEMAEQEDMRLDAQIDAWYEANRQPVKNEPDPEPAAVLIYDCGTTVTVENQDAPPILEMVEALGLTRQRRDVMGQDEDGTPNGQDYVEIRWVSQWERI